MNDIVITYMQQKDLQYIPELYKEYGNRNTDIQKMYDEYKRLQDNKDYLFIVAKDNEKVVGFMSVIINHDIVEQCKPFITIWNVRVKSEYRNKKIGTRMINFIEQYAKENNCDFIALLAAPNNKIAQSFYQSLGFNKDIGYIKKI
jgi:ribosomal protein S18 acetylase RimI-like enzyme